MLMLCLCNVNVKISDFPLSHNYFERCKEKHENAKYLFSAISFLILFVINSMKMKIFLLKFS